MGRRISRRVLPAAILGMLAGFATGCSSGAAPDATACTIPTDVEVTALYDRWNASLKTGDPDQVLANYAPESVLLPTLSAVPRITTEDKREYFVDFLAKGPSGTVTQRAVLQNCNAAADVGLYTFRFADGTEADARFTFTYAWDGEQWLITSHHSSLSPEEH